MKHIRSHDEPSFGAFLRRTVSAQLHLLGLIAASVGLGVLLHYAHLRQDHFAVFGCLAFGITGILVFAVSTGYHFISDGFVISPQLQRWLEDLDHFAIFLFIAGTYTPFILNVIQPPWKLILLILIWSIGIFGIIYTHFRPRLPAWAQHRYVYTSLFILMGWTMIIRIGEAISRISTLGAFFLLAGGVSYSIGAVIYATKKPNLIPGVFGFHELWHVMVLFGFGFHYAMVLNFYR